MVRARHRYAAMKLVAARLSEEQEEVAASCTYPLVGEALYSLEARGLARPTATRHGCGPLVLTPKGKKLVELLEWRMREHLTAFINDLMGDTELNLETFEEAADLVRTNTGDDTPAEFFYGTCLATLSQDQVNALIDQVVRENQ